MFGALAGETFVDKSRDRSLSDLIIHGVKQVGQCRSDFDVFVKVF